MERLYATMDMLLDEICEGMMRPKFIRSAIERKLADLKVLAEKCKKRNEELQITDGYRSLGPKADMEGVMHPVASDYHTSLSLVAKKFKEDVETANEMLSQAEERVHELAKIAESMMDVNGDSLLWQIRADS
ncbi:hypothetical protein DICVIV_07605 [Dictyocaulus viviparus]|uniref:Uncharacterized protein n=1 Tax=Dictyocaulus viviparus TaxID=29172 RepID=A0A0D8XRF7_DICVI|nr:hypothetical protein DICVIV_07605 [Dictyocaulus viviparus]